MKNPAAQIFGKILIIAAFLALLDQLLKNVSIRHFTIPVKIIDNLFTLTYVENTGIAFGIALPYLLIILINVLLVAGLIYLADRELDIKKKTAQIPLALIIGGALGNIYDRLSYGYVIDFISIWKWPAFNLADIYITVGVLLIVVFYGKIKRT